MRFRTRLAGVVGTLAGCWLIGCSDPARPTDAYLNYEFAVLDCDGNEALSWEELRRFTWQRALEGVEVPLRSSEFSAVDSDGDARLNIVEYTTLVNKDGHYHYSPHANCRPGQ